MFNLLILDSVILPAAPEHRATLWTRDAGLMGVAGVEYTAKDERSPCCAASLAKWRTFQMPGSTGVANRGDTAEGRQPTPRALSPVAILSDRVINNSSNRCP